MRGEILDGPERRRRWSEDEKTTILAELAKPGAKGAEIARRYGVSRGLVSVVCVTRLTATAPGARGATRRCAPGIEHGRRRLVGGQFGRAHQLAALPVL
jgi:hypothetical protein